LALCMSLDFTAILRHASQPDIQHWTKCLGPGARSITGPVASPLRRILDSPADIEISERLAFAPRSRGMSLIVGSADNNNGLQLPLLTCTVTLREWQGQLPMSGGVILLTSRCQANGCPPVDEWSNGRPSKSSHESETAERERESGEPRVHMQRFCAAPNIAMPPKRASLSRRRP
jgi:hypothetical protein